MTTMKLANGKPVVVNVLHRSDAATITLCNVDDVQNMILNIDPTLELRIGKKGRVYDATGTPLEDKHFEPLSGVKPKRWPYYFLLNEDETQSITQAEYDRLPRKKKRRYHIKPCIAVSSVCATYPYRGSEKEIANYKAIEKASKEHRAIFVLADHEIIEWCIYYDMTDDDDEWIAERYAYEHKKGNPTLLLAKHGFIRGKRALSNRHAALMREIADMEGYPY